MSEPAAPASPQPEPPRRFRWVRAAADRVPTKWFAGISTALFLAATASFGGLATVEAAGPAELSPGDEHRNAQLSVMVERAVLIDELPEAGISVEDGERVLVVVVVAENLWDRPLPTRTHESVSDALRIEDMPDAAPDGVARLDDGTLTPWLQPGVPAELVVAWAVDGTRYAEGKALRIVLHDETLYTGSMVLDEQFWDDPRPVAVVTAALRDVGAGVDAG
ncbi:hypothetical protein [Microbacterium sp. 18062]|uniref:hypothetical protein n=1 Tax=Microbacterium sp. 18062 TaxID=2681410 RepID=UPI001F255F41|nr:hypothetical protein [Microbacterium sp. 18062]